MRADLAIIQQWITPGCRLLDLGCGDGNLLQTLQQTRQTHGYGLEIDQDDIAICISKGLNVLEQDLNQGLSLFETDSFDWVIMTQALQAVASPDTLLEDMLRVGKRCIITFPNFGHWRIRSYLSWQGRMPKSKNLPYSWYDTPNIHLCTFKDFETLCNDKGFNIEARMVVNQNDGLLLKLWPNLFGSTAIYHLSCR